MLTRDDILAVDRRCVWHPYTPMGPYIDSGDPVVVDRAEGIWLVDRDGRRYIDACGSWWVSLLGHNHPRLVEALCSQARSLAHCAFAGMTHEPGVALAAALLPRLGQTYSRVFYTDDGSTAVEAAVRMALQYWRIEGRLERRRFVSLSHAFHGETLAAASLSDTDVFHAALGDIRFDCLRIPGPVAPGQTSCPRDWADRAFGLAEELLRARAREVAAVIVEPLVQGAAGMLMHPPEYLRRLYEICRDLDTLVIADEVFVGYGRTGTFLASHQAGIEPDIVCLAKGFTGGMLPMAATVVNERVFSAFRGGPERTLWYGHSFAGNPLGCSVALEVLRILDDERILESLPPRAAALSAGLHGIERHPWVHNPRRTGMIGAFTLAPPGRGPVPSDYASDLGRRFHVAARERGLLLRPLGNVIYFVLPLNVAVEDIERVFSIVRESLDAAFR